jgi:hypothetical protein
MRTMLKCDDAADTVVNGARDAADLAPPRTVPSLEQLVTPDDV